MCCVCMREYKRLGEIVDVIEVLSISTSDALISLLLFSLHTLGSIQHWEGWIML